MKKVIESITWIPRRTISFAGLAAASLVSVQLVMSTNALAQPQKYQFQRLGMFGLTVAWAGVVAEVDGNTVTPRFTVQNKVFFSRWSDFHAYAIQACRSSDTGFTPQEADCIETKGQSITVPEGTTPYEYAYKFKFKKDGTDMQESFALTKQTDLPDTEEIKWN